MSSKPNRTDNRDPEPVEVAIGERSRPGIRRVTRKSDAVPTRSILTAADNQAVNRTIGSKPNENSPTQRSGTRSQVKEMVI
jgi:hypothetical protein